MTTSIKVFIRGSKTPNVLLISTPKIKGTTNNHDSDSEKIIDKTSQRSNINFDLSSDFHKIILYN